MFLNWKTSLTGVGNIVFAVVGLTIGKLTWLEAGPMIAAGLGLIWAKDHNVTGGSVEQ